MKSLLKFLKEMVHAVTPTLTKIFHASIDKSQTSEDWKTANVLPTFKRETSKPANYRPVTSVCCKVVAHFIHSHLMNFFVYHKILTDYQHGFRKKRPCESQMITTIQNLAIDIEFNTEIDAVLLDFSKAFDS